MRAFLVHLVVLLLASTPSSAPPALGDVLVSIDKTRQQMTVWVDGTPRYSWPVSTGKRGYGTPAGSFRPFRMEREYFSRKWDNAPMPHAIFFTRVGHAIHGSYVVRRLGTPASHGCVRISPGNAATLYAVVRAEGLGGTRVVITGSELRRVAKVPGAERRAHRRSLIDDGYDGGVYEEAPPYQIDPYEAYPQEAYPDETGSGWVW
jgi:hypothetical protein